MILLVLSLVANCAITFVVGLAMLRQTAGMDVPFGPDAPARRILACVYLTIGLVSLYALAQMALGNGPIAVSIALTLLPLQIVYKLMTAIAVGIRHPVVLTNLAVVALHAVTLLTLI